MIESLASVAVTSMALYALVGLVFAVFFVRSGVGRIDPSADKGSWGFRLLILPGCVALWPLMLRRLRSRRPPPEEHNAHRDLAREPDPRRERR